MIDLAALLQHQAAAAQADIDATLRRSRIEYEAYCRSQAAADPAVIDVEARVVDDVPAPQLAHQVEPGR